ncbi:universal stress protein [Streptomyces durbertensis]|uniref:Universal stress protein n=1 Tax=Streptomyces durbertensis TaxID=2448886 RepID=A0ABR6EJ19_9ACTN|nr:universal stress protein [Streptomyces durbertensis]MBB1245332.1 universal stress protein [Streptomyces durbertensis]
MSAIVTVGVDGSPESRAAARWAADEARRRAATLDIVFVREVDPHPHPYTTLYDPDKESSWAQTLLREIAAEASEAHPGLPVTTRLLSGYAAQLLPEAAADSDMLVLGTRGIGAVAGFFIGSVGLPTVAHLNRPVVLVRAPEKSTAATPVDAGDVVVGLKLNRPAEDLLAFAFEAAAGRSARLRVLHTWDLPPTYGVRPIAAPTGAEAELSQERSEALDTALRPWREKYPTVEILCEAVVGRAAHHLIEAADGASLVVVGRRLRRTPIGARIGAVAHAVMHHATVPVAVVPHD